MNSMQLAQQRVFSGIVEVKAGLEKWVFIECCIHIMPSCNGFYPPAIVEGSLLEGKLEIESGDNV